MPSAEYFRLLEVERASLRAAKAAGKIHVVRVAAGHEERTVEVHDRDCPCLSCTAARRFL